MRKKAKITLKKEKCIGAGVCASVCPKFFEMRGGFSHLKGSVKNNSGVSELKMEVSEEDWPSVEEAARFCPVKAISAEIEN